jgi:tetratricopeptide (TPR) repeat protein
MAIALRSSFLLCVVLTALAPIAAAGDPPDAERLYNEGRALMDAGKPVEACEKFEQSLAKDPRQVGVIMNLALCNERAGKVATALRLYREALDRATEANLAGVRARASAEIDRLAPEVPVLTLAIDAPLPGEKLVIDDAVIPSSRTTVSLDPGRHAVVATAPGRLPFETTVTLVRAGREALRIPRLELPRQTVVVAGASSRRPIGKILTAGGAATVLVAGGLALYARHDYDALFAGTTPHCGSFPRVDGQPTCDAAGQSRSERDHKLGTAGLITGAVGLAAALTGVTLWVTAPADTQLSPIVTATGAGVILRGAF